jgi:hypothetical protein
MSRLRKRLVTPHYQRAVVVAATLVAIVGLGSAASAATTPAHAIRTTTPARAARTAPAHTSGTAVGKSVTRLKISPAEAGINAAGGEPGVCANCAPPLRLIPGGPVMGTAIPAGTVTITPIYWVPPGYNINPSESPTYTTTINRYITDIAAASSATSNVYGILPEYYSTTNGVNTNIKYSIAAGTPITDTTPYPTTGQCIPQPYTGAITQVVNYTACLTDPQVRTELASVIAANNLPTGLANLYVMFFPPFVQTQLSFVSPVQYSTLQFCGYHSSFTSGSNTIAYANEPWIPYCASGGYPNNGYADSEISILSHEINEAITDPTARSWGDSMGNENGDECNFGYGAPIGYTSGRQPYNQVINGDFYYTQTEFSNAAYAATGVGTGCRQSAFGAGGNGPLQPGAKRGTKPGAKRGTKSDVAGVTSAVTVDASPSTLPADGTSTSTITVTAVDSNGDPVAGDAMTVFTRDDDATPGSCGTLSDNDGLAGTAPLVTNAAGQVTVTYTASTASADCYVLATDNTVGTTNQTIVYQGMDGSRAPTVSETLPGTLVSGGPTATFTATATLPSSGIDIPDARFDLYLTGDDSGATGLNASQLSLSYKDDATGGDYVKVPLTGSTANGGVITGFVIPDTAEKLAAGVTRTATFRLTLADGAADTSVTGHPLKIETDLDQFNPADGSQTNLGRTAPGSVPVAQVAGDTVNYSGTLVTTSAPSGSTPGTAVLVAKTCSFASNGATCRLTATETFTSSGGTLTGTITSDSAGEADRVVTFTDTFTAATPTTGTGSGTGQLIYLDNGNSSTDNLTATYTNAPTRTNPNVATEQGTIILTNSTP